MRSLENSICTIVDLPELGGKGVLVNDSHIITATHCVKISWDGLAALNDYNLCIVKSGELEFKANIIYAEAVSDLAVLRRADDQEFPKDSELFDNFCLENEGIRLSGDSG